MFLTFDFVFFLLLDCNEYDNDKDIVVCKFMVAVTKHRLYNMNTLGMVFIFMPTLSMMMDSKREK